MKQDMIVILDLGSEENSALARAIRALGVYSEIYPHDVTADQIKALSNTKGIILNGGKNNVVDGKLVDVSDEVLALGIPTVAIDFQKSGVNTICPSEVKDFVFDIAKCQPNWNMQNFIDDQIELLRKQIGNKKVLLALSGGVDSSVVAALLIKAIGNNLTCVHVNHGLLRKGEPEQVIEVFRNQLGATLIYVDAVDRFLDKLAGVDEPEKKRKIIGAEFIRVFEEEARKLNGIDFLAQGTIYPDIVESGTKTNKAVKAHHNVGGLPDDLKFELVEPLKYLFKAKFALAERHLGFPIIWCIVSPSLGPVSVSGAWAPSRVTA
jgi:GMP synthase, PP-ATPase domain/subunit